MRLCNDDTFSEGSAGLLLLGSTLSVVLIPSSPDFYDRDIPRDIPENGEIKEVVATWVFILPRKLCHRMFEFGHVLVAARIIVMGIGNSKIRGRMSAQFSSRFERPGLLT